LFSTARNLATDLRRHDRVAATDTMDLEDSGFVSPSRSMEDSLIADEASDLLKAAVGRLPSQCRMAFSLKVFHGCSYREIGQQLGITEKTVQKHIARGLHDTHMYLKLRYPRESRDG
jgi:RNA polymerase sigma-70 factor (ECF subfamily)